MIFPWQVRLQGGRPNGYRICRRGRGVIREALSLEFDPPFETRETPAGRHLAITVTPWVESSMTAGGLRENPSCARLGHVAVVNEAGRYRARLCEFKW